MAKLLLHFPTSGVPFLSEGSVGASVINLSNRISSLFVSTTKRSMVESRIDLKNSVCETVAPISCDSVSMKGKAPELPLYPDVDESTPPPVSVAIASDRKNRCLARPKKS